jgi:hypothetical protein
LFKDEIIRKTTLANWKTPKYRAIDCKDRIWDIIILSMFAKVIIEIVCGKIAMLT